MSDLCVGTWQFHNKYLYNKLTFGLKYQLTTLINTIHNTLHIQYPAVGRAYICLGDNNDDQGLCILTLQLSQHHLSQLYLEHLQHKKINFTNVPS